MTLQSAVPSEPSPLATTTKAPNCVSEAILEPPSQAIRQLHTLE